MASKQDILTQMKSVVDRFGWDVNLLNGFWVDLEKIEPQKPIKFNKREPIYCNAVTLPNVSIEYEEVSISINKFRAPVPMAKTKSDLILEITGGTDDYIKNLIQLFKFNTNEEGGLDVASLYRISVYTFKANYDRIRSITYENCYIKDIGGISYEQSATNSFFKCPYTFVVGRITKPGE